MRRHENQLAVETICKPVGEAVRNWGDPNKLLRVAKRRRSREHDGHYFVVGVGDAVGYGVWLDRHQIRPLNALELLAMQAD